MSINDHQFENYVFPIPNMLVTPGSPVLIKNLQSEKGQALNGKVGIARHYCHGNDLRWLVEFANGMRRKIRIQNLEIRHTFVACFCFKSQGHHPDLVQAGTMDGQTAVMIYDVPQRDGFDIELVEEKGLLMGMPEGILRGRVEVKEPTPSAE
jgi:hypothetical protein